jgi:hypothetical protein
MQGATDMPLAQDLKFAIRQWKRNPGFSLTVILTLALSIGANTAIFSIVDALLLKALPYPHPERMGTIFTRITGPRPSDERHHVNGEQFELLRDHVPSLISAVTNGGTSGINLKAGSNVAYLQAARTSAHYFDVLDIHPFLGRNFSETEDRPHGPKAAILSYSSWKNIFGQNPDVIGQPVFLKGEPYTVVGVLSAGAVTPLNADLYTALQPDRDGEAMDAAFSASATCPGSSTLNSVASHEL